ncbi:MAG: hypothetical protein EA392_11790 [Cryomorphaceae bacterium]|nr:MAG: hypothetical protein EA392_11790 [Cryomorphaceae bacterium]
MNIAEVRNRIISQVERMDDADFLEAIMQLLDTRSASGQYQLSDEQKNRVAEARAEFAAGKSVPGGELMKDVEEWLKTK